MPVEQRTQTNSLKLITISALCQRHTNDDLDAACIGRLVCNSAASSQDGCSSQLCAIPSAISLSSPPCVPTLAHGPPCHTGRTSTGRPFPFLISAQEGDSGLYGSSNSASHLIFLPATAQLHLPILLNSQHGPRYHASAMGDFSLPPFLHSRIGTASRQSYYDSTH